MGLRISNDLERILLYAKEEAMRTGSYAITADHLMLGLLRDRDCPVCRMLENMGADLDDIKAKLDSALMEGRSIPFDEEDRVLPGRSAHSVLSLAMLEARNAGLEDVEAIHMFLGAGRHDGCLCWKFLSDAGITRDAVERTAREGLILTEKVTQPQENISDILAGEMAGILDILSLSRNNNDKLN